MEQNCTYTYAFFFPLEQSDKETYVFGEQCSRDELVNGDSTIISSFANTTTSFNLPRYQVLQQLLL